MIMGVAQQGRRVAEGRVGARYISGMYTVQSCPFASLLGPDRQGCWVGGCVGAAPCSRGSGGLRDRGGRARAWGGAGASSQRASLAGRARAWGGGAPHGAREGRGAGGGGGAASMLSWLAVGGSVPFEGGILTETLPALCFRLRCAAVTGARSATAGRAFLTSCWRAAQGCVGRACCTSPRRYSCGTGIVRGRSPDSEGQWVSGIRGGGGGRAPVPGVRQGSAAGHWGSAERRRG